MIAWYGAPATRRRGASRRPSDGLFIVSIGTPASLRRDRFESRRYGLGLSGSGGGQRSPGVRPGDGALISARHSMATATSLIVGSVDRAVTAGWHDGVSPNRLRRSSTESFWMSMNSAVVINRVTASRMSLILALTARAYKPAAEDRLKAA